MKYFTFGMKNLRVTQGYNEGNHLPHWKDSKDFSDYPIDLGDKDGGRSIYFATVDLKITAIRGIGTSMTNTIWLVATEKCKTPLGEITPFIMLTHWNDDDPYINKYKTGDIIKAGSEICLEGTDGATANHLHFVCGNAEQGCGDDIIKNSNGKWVSNGYCYRPEQILYIDKEFTNIMDTRGIDFQVKPKESDVLLKDATNEQILLELEKRLNK